MKYRYSARTKTGELQVGFVESVSKEAALNILSSHDLFILSIESIERPAWYNNLISFFNRVKRQDLMIFTRQFATMLEASISLGDSLKSLYRQTKNNILRETIFEISSDVSAGLSLSQALERHSNIFSEFYINLIRSAEVTGQMERAMTFLADYLEKEISLLTKVRNALIYPVFVVVLFIVTSGILMGVVFPQIEPIFRESNVALPTVTQIFLTMGRFIANWWLAIILVAAILIILLIDYFRTEEGKVVFDQLAINMPLFGNLFKKVYVARFAEAASVLIKGGIPIAQAIEISGHTIGSILYREALHEVSEGLRRGELLSQALEQRENFFPPLVSQMVAVGENTGRLDEMFDRISIFYTRDVDSLVSGLVELIQPALILFIGALVGLLFASILLPIYNLVQVF
ncbi:MAG: type II secretion system F family protein [Patescibacteria group bacterium]